MSIKSEQKVEPPLTSRTWSKPTFHAATNLLSLLVWLTQQMFSLALRFLSKNCHKTSLFRATGLLSFLIPQFKMERNTIKTFTDCFHSFNHNHGQLNFWPWKSINLVRLPLFVMIRAPFNAAHTNGRNHCCKMRRASTWSVQVFW